MHNLLKYIVFILYLFSPFVSSAQFYSAGDDPAKIKWNQIKTNNFNIIYPRELDSLARIYGENLEKYRIPVSRSVGYLPGEYTPGKIPVILHSYNTVANGSVAWAPKRMDLFTTPTAYSPEPIPWVKMLAIHESRHVAQMQFGLSHSLRPFYWFLGEMANGAFAGLYARNYFLEGDAVSTETALTNSGRGRSGSFLNRYMISFDNGDFRNWRKWRFGSYKHLTPDHYALGYLYISGLRYFYDAYDYSETFLKQIAKHPLNIYYSNKISSKYTGLKHRKAFDAIMKSYHQMWQEEIDARKPFIYSELVSPEANTHTEYSGLALVGTNIYAIKKSFNNSSSLINIDYSGEEKTICPFAMSTSNLKYYSRYNSLLWSETATDKRWSQKASSNVRLYNISPSKRKTITKDKIYYFPTPNKEKIIVTEYTNDTKSAITILRGIDGNVESRYIAPSGVQFIQAAMIGSNIYALGLAENGYGIWELTDKTTMSKERENKSWKDWEEVVAPSPVLIKDFGATKTDLIFTSDRTGVNELYHYNPQTGIFFQKTSTRYGASDFNYSEDGYLYYCAEDVHGTQIYKSPIDSLLNKQVDFFDRHKYRIADKLSAQEDKLAKIKPQIDSLELQKISHPEPYRKWLNIPNFHSWAPLYFDIDNVKAFSYDDFDYRTAALGLTAISQNHLGTASGQVGYSAHPDPYDKSKWRHAGHLRYKYSGLFPVFELSLDLNDRAAIQYNYSSLINDPIKISSLSGKLSNNPHFKGNLSVYVPLNLSSGGWYRGLVPQLNWSFSNDVYNLNESVTTLYPNIVPGGQSSIETFESFNENKFIYNHRLSGSIRAYTMMGTAHSGVYPRFGGGLEIGAGGELGMTKYINPSFYLYGYGYLPGFLPKQGLKLNLLWQESLNTNSLFSSLIVNTLPRGLAPNFELLSSITTSNSSIKIGADYAIPIYVGDFSLLNLLYAKRCVITPHFDYSFIQGNGGLYSAGLSATMEFAELLWIETDIELGVTYSYNGGSGLNRIASQGLYIGHHYVGPIVKFTLPE